VIIIWVNVDEDEAPGASELTSDLVDDLARDAAVAGVVQRPSILQRSARCVGGSLGEQANVSVAEARSSSA
jgi:hypothetical protein